MIASASTSRIARAIGVGLVGALAVAGCSGGGGGTKVVGTPTAKSTVPSGDNSGLKDPKGAISALSGFECQPGKDGTWKAKGTVTNATGTQGKFLVTVAVIKKKGSSVLGKAETTVTLDSEGKKDFDLSHVYAGKSAKGLACVPRVVVGASANS